MDFEGIPGISDELNSEFQSMNEEFTERYDEKDGSDDDSHTSLSLLTWIRVPKTKSKKLLCVIIFLWGALLYFRTQKKVNV